MSRVKVMTDGHESRLTQPEQGQGDDRTAAQLFSWGVLLENCCDARFWCTGARPSFELVHRSPVHRSLF